MNVGQAYLWVVAALLTFGSAPGVRAQEPPPPPGAPVSAHDYDDGYTPPRLSFMHGEVSFWRPGAGDWTRAQRNLPLAPGDALYAGDGASFELEIGPRAFIRAGERTQVGLENQEPDFLQLKLTSGYLAVDVREIEAGHTIELNTPNAAFAVEDGGYYRVDVTDTASAFIARRGGRALVTPVNGEVRVLTQNERIVIEGIDAPTFASYPAGELDAWDRWNYQRTDDLAETKSARYVPAGVYGTHDLDEHGSWEETRDYGAVWTPRHVSADWAPYSDGRWVWDTAYGWTWVDNAPWGWAPSHYGRWVHVRDRWGWAPGPLLAAPVYAPAVVAFFGGRNLHVSVGLPVPAVGWVALGWGEPLVPWWGRRGYSGVPSWRGWGGPRVVNRTVINNTTIVNVNHIHEYQNARIRNAVVAERRDRFGRGWDRHARVRLRAGERLEPVRGSLGVRPVSASLSPRREKGVRPPDEILRRPVVATRPARDPASALRAQGIKVDNKVKSAPRIVRSARPGRDQPQQPAVREQAAPQTAPRRQQDVQPGGQSAPRVGRVRELPRKQDQAEPAARSAPTAPAARARPSLQQRDASGEAAGAKSKRPAKQARPQSEPQHGPAAPQVKQPAPQRGPQQARPRQSRPQPEQRSTKPAPQKQAPVLRSAPQQERAQPPAVRARPESAPRQPAVRDAQPRREAADRPQRAQRKQQAPADASSRQRPMSAGDAPRAAPAKKNAPAKNDVPAKNNAPAPGNAPESGPRRDRAN